VAEPSAGSPHSPTGAAVTGGVPSARAPSPEPAGAASAPLAAAPAAVATATSVVMVPASPGTVTPAPSPTTAAPRPTVTTTAAPVERTFTSVAGSVRATCPAPEQARLLSWTAFKPYKLAGVDPGPAHTVQAVFKRGESTVTMTVTCDGGVPASG
jgi:serine/threonine-protein kinase